MRPIKLSMTAFGPFVETEVIDFEALGDKPLFLINGATGAGKTTILDAICFALYGQTTGKEREAAQMRCDYASDKTLTEVELVFELAGDIYRISRIPEQQRAKSKGEGTTRQAARAELWQLDGTDEGVDGGPAENLLVARKVSDATRKIEQLTGLQVDQFRQVMVLPQGQFRRLLMADSKDREQIFSQLFETRIYKRIEDKLKARAKKVYIEVERLKDNQQGILQSVEFETTDQLDTAIHTLGPECDKAGQQKKSKERVYIKAEKKMQAAHTLAQDFQNLKKQKQKLAALKQQASAFDEKRKEIKHAEQAQKIEPVFIELSRCSEESNAVSAKLEAAEKRYKETQSLLKESEQELTKNTARSSQLDGHKKELASLQSYRERAKKLQQAEDNLRQIQQKFRSGKARLEKASKDLIERSRKLEQTEQQKQSLETQLVTNENVSLQLQKLSGQLNQKKHYDDFLSKKSRLEIDFQNTAEKDKALAAGLENKKRDEKQLEFAWYNGQAAILARDLKQQQACPVCGSLEHPRPAREEQALPSDQQRKKAHQGVEIAQSKLQTARETYADLNSQLRALNTQISEQQKQLGGLAETPIDELTQQHIDLSEQEKQFKNHQNQLKSLGENILALKQQEQVARKNQEALSNDQAVLNTGLQVNKAALENAEKELPEAYRQTGKLEQAILLSEESIQQLEKNIKQALENNKTTNEADTTAKTMLKNLQDVQKNTQTSLKQAISAWQHALDKSAFEDQRAYQKAHCSEETLKTLKEAIEAYEQQCQQASGALKQQNKALKDKEAPDIDALQQHLALVIKDKAEAEESWKQQESRLSHLKKAQQTLLEITIKQQKEEDEYKVIGTLSHVANGLTGNKISLQRFVLGVLLDDVLIEASHRLKIMSKNRYLLLRKEDRAKGNKASGLELEVEDSYTGKVRPVSTLSGGESFMASLSLALGLSDVVQAYAGGIHLDTLFIDEGFGSLDTDSLDLAIRTLIDLRNTGRMVGIISHVSELKEQIGLRLDVVSGRCGSTIRLIH